MSGFRVPRRGAASSFDLARARGVPRGLLDRVRGRERPHRDRLPAAKALALAGLGRREEALAAAAEARRRLPVSIDSWAGAALVEREAEILAMFGMVDDAVARLEWLLAVGGGRVLTPALLRVEPCWDPLRGDARFEALVAGEGPADPPPPPPFAS